MSDAIKRGLATISKNSGSNQRVSAIGNDTYTPFSHRSSHTNLCGWTSHLYMGPLPYLLVLTEKRRKENGIKENRLRMENLLDKKKKLIKAKLLDLGL